MPVAQPGSRRFRRCAVRARWGLMALVVGLMGQALADTHALLIGVAQVAALPERLRLRGPDNDVALMRQWLRERGVAADHILSLSRATGDTPPTHAHIVQAMQLLLQRVQPGDAVVLHLAGHGVQVPQRPGAEPEPDALDEVFLAADTQTWDAQRGVLPQALYDHDIGAWLDALATRQVQVLAVLDTCHAAGLQRGATGFARERGIAAAELSVPAQRPRPAGLAWPAVQGHASAGPVPGRTLALAARAHESTPEEWLPKGELRSRVQGVFTYSVVQAWRGGAHDAAALAAALQQLYAQAGRGTPVPMVVGQGTNRLP